MFGLFAGGNWRNAYGLCDIQMRFIQVAEGSSVADYSFNVSRLIQFEGHIFLLHPAREVPAISIAKNKSGSLLYLCCILLENVFMWAQK